MPLIRAHVSNQITCVKKCKKCETKSLKFINKIRQKRALDDKCEFLPIDGLFRKEIAIFMFKHKTIRLPFIFEDTFQLSKIDKIEARNKTRIIL